MKDLECELLEWLRCQLGCKVPGPLRLHGTRWGREEYIRGRHDSHRRLCPEEMDAVRVLEEPMPRPNGPLPPVLFFAGDCVCPTMHASLHEASLTGNPLSVPLERALGMTIVR